MFSFGVRRKFATFAPRLTYDISQYKVNKYWEQEYVGFHPSFSRHGITRASSVLLIWLNENVAYDFIMSETEPDTLLPKDAKRGLERHGKYTNISRINTYFVEIFSFLALIHVFPETCMVDF